MGAAGLCPERPPGLLYHACAPLFGRGSILQTRFCLCTQYCHWTRAGAISALPIRAFRACGCCGPMPRRPPDSSATRALLSLAVAVCYRCASACAHSTVATPAGNAHRTCQMSHTARPRTNLKGGRRACRRPQVWTCPCWPEGMRATPTRFLKVSRRPPAAPEATSAGLKRGCYPDMRSGPKNLLNRQLQ